ncbi:hypothetical protein Tco_0675103 [Tanacetum coccineum]
MEQMTTLRDLVGQVIQKKEEEKRIAEEQAAKDRYWKIPICYDDDDNYTIAITPCENLIPIPSEPEGIPDSVCDVPLCNNPTSLEAFKEHSETIIDSNDDSTSSDDDSYENIDYVDASPPDDEIVSLEVVEIVYPEVGRIDTDILLTIKDDLLPSDFYHEEFAGELAHIISPPEYDHFCFKIEPELGNLTMDVVNDIFPQENPEFMCLMIARILKPLVLTVFVLRSQELHNSQLHLGIPIS